MGTDDPPRILVVDDEIELCNLLVDALGEDDLCVDVATDADEALALVNRDKPPDLVVMDLYLGACDGLDVIDRYRSEVGDIPTIVITGKGTTDVLARASRRRPVEMMTKPLDLDHLRKVVRAELDRQAQHRRWRTRSRHLRSLARNANIRYKQMQHKVESTGAELTQAYRQLSAQLETQQVVADFQHQLLAATNEDNVFRALFRSFVPRSGPLFGIALTCNQDADLQIVGRFGVPKPDSLRFCQALCEPLVNYALTDMKPMLMDTGEQTEMFDPSIRKYLVGITALSVPLICPQVGITGIAILYRKGEQPFVDADVELAEQIAPSAGTALSKMNNAP